MTGLHKETMAGGCQEGAVHRSYRCWQDLCLQRDPRGQDPHRRGKLRRAAGCGVNLRKLFCCSRCGGSPAAPTQSPPPGVTDRSFSFFLFLFLSEPTVSQKPRSCAQGSGAFAVREFVNFMCSVLQSACNAPIIKAKGADLYGNYQCQHSDGFGPEGAG